MFEQVRCCHLWITLMKQRMTLCLYLLRHTFLILFGRKTYFRRYNKVKSDSPENDWSSPLFALIMLKREREHSGYSKPACWKSRGQKDREKKKKIQVLSAFDCSCVHFVHIYTAKVIQMKKKNQNKPHCQEIDPYLSVKGSLSSSLTNLSEHSFLITLTHNILPKVHFHFGTLSTHQLPCPNWFLLKACKVGEQRWAATGLETWFVITEVKPAETKEARYKW